MNGLSLFFTLLVGHALADYPLQGEFLARAKSRMAPMPGVPWYHALAAHALIHGGAVALLTGVWWLGVIETVCHAWIDDRRCCGRLSFNADQALHIACKMTWVAVVIGLEP